MTSDFLLDSGVLIRVLRHDQRAVGLVSHLSNEGRIMASSIVVLEVFRGCRNDSEQSEAATFFAATDIINFGYDLAVFAGRLLREWPGIFSSEKAIPDAIITASAISASATLVTLNTRQFSQLRIAELQLILIDQQAPDWIPPSL